MAEPIKTTIQEAFDHIKSWIAEGSKEKAIQGLNEILNFDPTNAEAQKLLLEVKTGEVAAVAPITTSVTSAPVPEPMPPMPPRAVPMTPLAPSAPEGATKIVGIMGNMKLIIAIGGVVIAIIAGFIFYRSVLSSVNVISEDVKSVQDAQTQVLETTTTPTDTSLTPDATTLATPDATIPATPDATTPTTLTPDAAITPVVSDPSKVEATSGKVKRK